MLQPRTRSSTHSNTNTNSNSNPRHDNDINGNGTQRRRRRKWKKDVLIILATLSLMYSHFDFGGVNAEMQTGIFPRGGAGALKTYTDVLHIAQRRGSQFATKARTRVAGTRSNGNGSGSRNYKNRVGQAYGFQNVRDSNESEQERENEGERENPQQFGREHGLDLQPLLCGDVCTMRRTETPTSTSTPAPMHVRMQRRFGRFHHETSDTHRKDHAARSMSPPFVSTRRYDHDDDEKVEERVSMTNPATETATRANVKERNDGYSGNDNDSATTSSSSEGKPTLSYVLTRKSRKRSKNEDGGTDINASDASTDNAADASTTSNSNTSTNTNNNTTGGGNPLIYRYWNRSRVRRRDRRATDDASSVSFLILGPRVDHWKLVGKILASRGFNVMACERSKEQQQKGYDHDGSFRWGGDDGEAMEMDTEGEALVSSVLDALKWQKAILVACDREAVLAMEAALRLAPDRVAGLVFCGDLSYLEDHVRQQIVALSNQQHDDGEGSGSGSASSSGGVLGDYDDMNIDSFLRDFVDCPCSIIWDGDSSTWTGSKSDPKSHHSNRHRRGKGREDDDDHTTSISLSRDMDSGRSVIIGGGLAPHRRLPEQFAWSLTRFVENRVSLSPPSSHVLDHNDMGFEPEEDYSTTESEDEYDDAYDTYDGIMSEDEDDARGMIQYPQKGIWNRILPARMMRAFDNVFAPGSLLVTGRIVASIIIYLSITRVSIFQYQNIRNIQMMKPRPMSMSVANANGHAHAQWKRVLQALPAIVMRRMQNLRGKNNTTDSSASLGDLFQDEVDEHEKLNERISPPLEDDAGKNQVEGGGGGNVDGDNKTPQDDEGKQPEPDASVPVPVPVPVPPSHDEHHDPERHEDRDRERELDNRLFHKFLFFDQIVS